MIKIQNTSTSKSINDGEIHVLKWFNEGEISILAGNHESTWLFHHGFPFPSASAKPLRFASLKALATAAVSPTA